METQAKPSLKGSAAPNGVNRAMNIARMKRIFLMVMAKA